MAIMGRSAAAREEKVPLPPTARLSALDADPRWQLSQRVVASRHFSKSPLLSKFLLYIVAETLEERSNEITEHQIGVRVFDRPSTYRTVEDNIVRNYARQLRRRLCEYFVDEGAADPLRIDIPLGGYIPVFIAASDMAWEQERQGNAIPISIHAEHPYSAAKPVDLPSRLRRIRNRPLTLALLLIVYSSALLSIAWFAAVRVLNSHSTHEMEGAAAPLWDALFAKTRITYIVPADAGLNLLEDLSQRPMPLADYIHGGYSGMKLPAMDSHSEDDLRSQHFTSFVDLQTVSALARLPQYDPQRTVLRFPRDLRLDDLRNANAVIIGSVGSNPWTAVAESNANFRIVYHEGMQGATIVNSKPLPGEEANYISHWNDPVHETFALISCLPNLEGSGRVLVLQGLDVAGTQAAAEALFHPDAIAPILRSATRPDGSLRYFEILLRSTSIESGAAGTQVIGSRIY
jgi:hypothetical protein